MKNSIRRQFMFFNILKLRVKMLKNFYLLKWFEGHWTFNLSSDSQYNNNDDIIQEGSMKV